MIDVLQGLSQLPSPTVVRRGAGPRPVTSFEDLLRTAQQPEQPPAEAEVPELKFSKHAQARLASRGIEVDGPLRARLEASLEKLAAKGANEALVMVEDNAFIVGVPKRTVITAMSRSEAMGNVFTKIDSVLFAA